MKELIDKIMLLLEQQWKITAIVAASLLLLAIIFFIIIIALCGKLKKSARVKDSSANEAESLQSQSDEFERRTKSLDAENKRLKFQINELQSVLDGLRQQNSELKDEIKNLSEQAEALRSLAEENQQALSDDEQVDEEEEYDEEEYDEEDYEEVEGELDEEEEEAEVKHSSAVGFIVVFDRLKNNWVIKKKGADRATRRADTKEEAVKIAKELCRRYGASLSILKKDGRFQKHKATKKTKQTDEE